MKALRWIASIGLSLGLIFLALAFITTTGMSRDFTGRAPTAQSEGRLEWTWDGGDRARIGVPGTVHYQAGGAPRVTVRGPADLLKRVRFQDGELTLEQDWFDGGSHGERLDITLTGMTLRDIGIAGSARMDMGEIHQNDLKVSISGSGRFNASGSADDLSLRVSGSGGCDVGALAARAVRVDISGSGHVAAASPQSAEVSISGSGQLRFAAIPRDISSHISGSGRISDARGQVITRRYHRERG
jgi:autotransporter translocation and assembly factor TamB